MQNSQNMSVTSSGLTFCPWPPHRKVSEAGNMLNNMSSWSMVMWSLTVPLPSGMSRKWHTFRKYKNTLSLLIGHSILRCLTGGCQPSPSAHGGDPPCMSMLFPGCEPDRPPSSALVPVRGCVIVPQSLLPALWDSTASHIFPSTSWTPCKSRQSRISDVINDTGENDTSDKLFTGVNDTGDKLFASINDSGSHWISVSRLNRWWYSGFLHKSDLYG